MRLPELQANYAIVDNAQGEILLPSLSSFHDASSLFRGKLSDELQDAAPRLVALNEPRALASLVKSAWGKSSLILLHSNASMEELRSHFRRFLIVATEDGARLYFRFYDPRVLPVFLITCDREQLQDFFGPITAFWIEDDDPSACLEFRLSQHGLERVASEAPLC